MTDAYNIIHGDFQIKIEVIYAMQIYRTLNEIKSPDLAIKFSSFFFKKYLS